jgi:hypothetical protein
MHLRRWRSGLDDMEPRTKTPYTHANPYRTPLVCKQWYSLMQSDPTFPALEPLDLDGKNFANACAKVPSWQENLSETKALAVTIANHTPVSNRIKLYAHSWI